MQHSKLIDDFLENGFVTVRGAFTRAAAAEFSKDVWTRLGYAADDPSTWAEHRIHMPSLKSVPVSEFAPDVWEAMKTLCGGEDRIGGLPRWGDSFIVNLGAADHAEKWEPPSPSAPGWHKDGDFFRHFLDSPEQGLLVIVLWSDVHPTGGATFLAEDSVKPVAEFLASRTEGLLPNQFDFVRLIKQCHHFSEATGEAGDVFLLHPYLLHASSLNALRLPRLITNPPIHLKEPMRFDRPDGDYSPVERAVLQALDVSCLAFQPTAPREKVIPERVRHEKAVREAEEARLRASR